LNLKNALKFISQSKVAEEKGKYQRVLFQIKLATQNQGVSPFVVLDEDLSSQPLEKEVAFVNNSFIEGDFYRYSFNVSKPPHKMKLSTILEQADSLDFSHSCNIQKTYIRIVEIEQRFDRI